MNLHFVKRALMGLAFISALALTPALASSPTLTDNGSAYWEVNVNGSNFTPNNWAYVEVVEANGSVSASGWFHTSSYTCVRSPLGIQFCGFGGGAFSATLYPNGGCSYSRTVEAIDYATGLRSNVLPVSCR